MKMKKILYMVLCMFFCISITLNVKAEVPEVPLAEKQSDEELTYYKLDLETGEETEYQIDECLQMEGYRLAHPLGGIVMLKIFTGSGMQRIATGTLVNNDTVITSAENIYDRNKKKYVVDVVAYPGFRTNTGYLGGSQAKTFYTNSAYKDLTNSKGSTYNYAAIKLKKKMNIKEYIPLEAKILSEADLLKYNMRKAYYDSQMKFQTKDGKITKINGKFLEHKMITSNVWEGGPIYRKVSGTYYMVGIATNQTSSGRGVRIDQTVINFIESAKKK